MKMIVTAVALTLAASGSASAMDSLSGYGWKNRVLVLFGGSNDQEMRRQVAILSAQASRMAERDMVVLQVSDGRVKAIFGRDGDFVAHQLRREADIRDDGFHAVLIGKDGKIKLRSENVVGDVEMFDFIDRMPMRRAGQS